MHSINAIFSAIFSDVNIYEGDWLLFSIGWKDEYSVEQVLMAALLFSVIFFYYIDFFFHYEPY